uniref:7TM GPCR serpentine receptor class x (Srx) domain-containing protein n=1 Tax=Romanomermis culicivorax TaxID=13658 RepID=A0A915ILG6_ROMCU
MDIATIAGYLVIQLVPHSRWTAMISNYIWLFCAGNCSLIYLTLNGVVRARFLKMFCKNRVVPVSTIDGPQTITAKKEHVVTAAKISDH